MNQSFDLGFLGGGQLARMSIQAAQRMGLSCLSLDPDENSPASQVSQSISGSLDDPARIAEIIRRCDRVTFENEFVPIGAVREALREANKAEEMFCPSLEALETVQDKLLQRKAYERAGVSVPRAAPIPEGAASEGLGFELPIVLKSRFGGYDGKGTRTIRDQGELSAQSPVWSNGGWMAEEFVPFRRELAQMVLVFSGGVRAFPTMVSVQVDHVCDHVFPADTNATEVAVAAAEAIGGPGLFGVEMFEMDDGRILVNEIAPRPHNSGHFTLDWGGISQFEAHVRVAMGLPVAEPRGGDVCMANLLGIENAGDHKNGMRAAMEDPDVRVHWYGKSHARPGRKMGHLNVPGENCVLRALDARERFFAAWRGGS